MPAPAPALPPAGLPAAQRSRWQVASRAALWIAARIVLTLALLLASGWGALALWYQLPAIATFKLLAALLWCVVGVVALVRLWRRSKSAWQALWPYALLLAGLLSWWSTIAPSHQRIWADDVARMMTSSVDGSIVTLNHVRNFDWHSDTDYVQRWETRSYDLNQLRSVDMTLSYWMGPAIAHTLVSFGFADGRYLTFSVEIRKERGETFSAIGGFFRKFETVLIAADERDILRVRTNVRGEDDYMYRVRMRPADMRSLFLAYLDEGEQLRRHPSFYNTLSANCTTVVFDMARRIVRTLPLDYRLLASGYLDEYLYDAGGLVKGYTLAQLHAAGRITERAKAADADPAFSQAIRRGMPVADAVPAAH
jgi:hypothetical protein